MPKTYYDVLGISVQASHDTIRSAFRRKAQVVHPDKIQSQTAALDPYAAQRLKEALEQDFRELKEAYDVLTDARKKKEYDELLKQMHAASAGQKGSSQQSASSHQTSSTPPHSQAPPSPSFCTTCGSHLSGNSCPVCAKRQASLMWKMGAAGRQVRIWFRQNTLVFLVGCLFFSVGLPIAIALPKWARWDPNLCGSVLSFMSILALFALMVMRPAAKWMFNRQPKASLLVIGAVILIFVAVSVGATTTLRKSPRIVDASNIRNEWRTNTYGDQSPDRYTDHRSSMDTLTTEYAILECKDHPSWSMWRADGSPGLTCPDFFSALAGKGAIHAEPLPIPKPVEIRAPVTEATKTKSSAKTPEENEQPPAPPEPEPLPLYGSAGGCGAGSFLYDNAGLSGGPIALVNNGQVLRLGPQSGNSYPAQVYDFKEQVVLRSGFISSSCVLKVWSPERASEPDPSLAAIPVSGNSAEPNAGAAVRNLSLAPRNASMAVTSGRPDVSGLSAPEQQSIEAACSHAKYLEGPAAYNACLQGQLARLGTTKRPDISALSGAEQQSIESACSQAKYLQGPAAYDSCLARQLELLENQKP